MKIDLDELLKEDNILDEIKEIKYPTKNQKIVKEYPKGTYIFENNEQFKGRIKNNKLTIGIYKWPNGQQYLGDLSDNNNFTKRGTIIFPNNNKLIGNFVMKENKIKNVIYETKTRKYEGSFVNNRLDGRFIIKNKEKSPHYFFKGTYSNGRRQGNFILEKIINDKLLQITGAYDKGQKNGIFRVFLKLKDDEKKLIYEKNFDHDRIVYIYKHEEKIENKKVLLDYKSPYKIYCLKVIRNPQNKIHILIGSYENIIIFDINDLNTPHPILIFKKEIINDILVTKEGKMLFCSNQNNFKLIETLSLEEEEEEKNNESELETITYSWEDEIKVIQEFKGLKNSKSIFVMKQLSNGLIASGDCENLILWDCFYENNFYEYKMVNHINLTHTYCILEIKKGNNENNNVILSLAQPDSKSILFLDINNNQIKLIKKIENVNTIENRKNIMKQDDKILFIGGQDSIMLINLIKYEIITKIFFDKITYINFLNQFLLCGIIKNKTQYSYEGYLTQIRLESNNNQLQNIEAFIVSKNLNNKHNGSIIDGLLFQTKEKDGEEEREKDVIITIGSDNKIIILK